MLTRPELVSALALALLFQLEGSVSSKPPRKLAAKTTSSTQRNRLNTAFVLSALSPFEPVGQSRVTSRPSPTYMTTMANP